MREFLSHLWWAWSSHLPQIPYDKCTTSQSMQISIGNKILCHKNVISYLVFLPSLLWGLPFSKNTSVNIYDMVIILDFLFFSIVLNVSGKRKNEKSVRLFSPRILSSSNCFVWQCIVVHLPVSHMIHQFSINILQSRTAMANQLRILYCLWRTLLWSLARVLRNC